MTEKNYTQKKSTNPNIHSSKRLIRIDKLLIKMVTHFLKKEEINNIRNEKYPTDNYKQNKGYHEQLYTQYI